MILDHIKAKQLPYPLARQLEAYNSASPGQKLSTMKDFIETSIKYLIGILAADLTNKTISSDESPLSRGSSFPKSTKRIKSVSMLGTWRDELKKWYKEYKEIPESRPLFVPEIREILSQPFDLTNSEKDNFLNAVSENQEQSDQQKEDTTESDESALVGFLSEFLGIRNDYLGHPLCSLNPRESDELAKAIEPAFCCFKKRMQILANYPLFLVKDYEDCREDRKIREYTVQTFMGDSETGKKNPDDFLTLGFLFKKN